MNIGYKALTIERLLVETGATDLSTLTEQLKDKSYDGVVIGNGIRNMKINFTLFERLVNAAHLNTAHAKIIFNTLPTDTD